MKTGGSMNSSLVILKKESKGFLFSPTFWVICFLVSIVFSWVYPMQLNAFAQLLTNYVMQQGVPQNRLNIHYSVFVAQLSYLNLLLIFLIPALSMKLLSEEKKLRTFDLLLTSPISSGQIVVGKYLALLTAILGVMVVSFIYPLATSLLADVQWAPLVVAFIGIFLLGSTYAAMNLFASSLTENSIVAYVLAVIFNMLIWFVGNGAALVDGETGRRVFEHISLANHLSALVEGTIRSSSLVFFASIIVLFCFLTERVVESSRWR